MPGRNTLPGRRITVLLGSVWKLLARRCAAGLDRRQEETTRRIGTEIRRGGATPPTIPRRKQRPRGVFRQSLSAAGATLLLAQTIYADTTIQVQSDANTLCAALGPGVPTDDQLARLNTPDISGLTFAPVDVGDFGTNVNIPPGAPPATSVVNLPPDDGENGYFKVTFNLSAGGPYYQIQGAANVDDVGRVFLNGN